VSRERRLSTEKKQAALKFLDKEITSLKGRGDSTQEKMRKIEEDALKGLMSYGKQKSKGKMGEIELNDLEISFDEEWGG
jgi:hypothetical protein